MQGGPFMLKPKVSTSVGKRLGLPKCDHAPWLLSAKLIEFVQNSNRGLSGLYKSGMVRNGTSH